ncbi:MAG: transposase family protein [Kaiparowitsia implicata GSE-PSE-MK54-09C]|jgi:hypothetical protein|nr:transposase family protein [Kaiparowitsia implicata GSE-PSE-MK54-09C]
MKMTYAGLRTKSGILCSLPGLKVQEFEALLPSFAMDWNTFIQETFQREGRKRAIGAGRNAHLMLFILMYFRLYPTQTVRAYLFEMSQA